MRGRKPKENSFSDLISIRITKGQKKVILKNKWLKDDLVKYVREYLQDFVMD